MTNSTPVTPQVAQSARPGIKAALVGISRPLLSPLLSGRALTVLCYHRVVEDVEAGLFPELNSATPDSFARQLDLITDEFDVVDENAVRRWLGGDGSLPDRPLLLTFDDGYRDNYENVYPALRQRGIPATIFLTTGHLDTGELLWWDLASALIARSPLDETELPLLGLRSLGDPPRFELAREWIESAKRVPDGARRTALDDLPVALGMTELPSTPRVSLTWDEVREMSGNGISFGGHTDSHPILSRMTAEESFADIRRGLERIREELGREVATFAYPNGGPADFTEDNKRVLSDLDISLGFSLSSGPSSRREVERDPLAIRRIYVGRGDSLESLHLKMLGLGRAADRVRRG